MLQAELLKKVDWDCAKLQLPHGTTVSLQYFSKSSQQKHQIPLTVSPHSNVFYALFKEDDVDFEIVVDNTTCKNNDVCLELTLQNKSYGFLVQRGFSTTFTTVVSEGGKFHFISQSGPEGQSLVAEAAMDHGTSFAAAEELVSRIQFGFKYSPWKEELMKLIIVDAENKKETSFYMNPAAYVDSLSQKFGKHTGYSTTYFRLLFDGRRLENDKKLSDYELMYGDKIYVYYEVYGGGPGGDCDKEFLLKMQRPGTTPKPDYILGAAGAGVGERGVVCLGEASTQRFRSAHFDEDESVRIQPFIVEMRMASKFKLVK